MDELPILYWAYSWESVYLNLHSLVPGSVNERARRKEERKKGGANLWQNRVGREILAPHLLTTSHRMFYRQALSLNQRSKEITLSLNQSSKETNFYRVSQVWTMATNTLSKINCFYAQFNCKRVIPLACERVITCRVRAFTLFSEPRGGWHILNRRPRI